MPGCCCCCAHYPGTAGGALVYSRTYVHARADCDLSHLQFSRVPALPPSPPSPFQFGQTALHIAALWGNIEAIDVLLDLGVEPSIINSRSVWRYTRRAGEGGGAGGERDYGSRRGANRHILCV